MVKLEYKLDNPETLQPILLESTHYGSYYTCQDFEGRLKVIDIDNIIKQEITPELKPL